MKNNLDKVETVNPTDNLELDVKTLQKRLGEKLGINQMSILLLVHFYLRITRNELSQLLGFSFTSVDVNLNKLKYLHLLERVGARKNGYWQINLESENDVNMDKSEIYHICLFLAQDVLARYNISAELSLFLVPLRTCLSNNDSVLMEWNIELF